MIPILALAYSAIIGPLLYFYFPPAPGLEGMMESRTENRLFWPAMAAISALLAARYWSRAGKMTMPPNITSLLVYAAFAGTSVAWSFHPPLTLIRFVQEVMVLMTIILPAMVAVRSADIMRGAFLCFAVAAAVNAALIPQGYVTVAKYGSTLVDIGYPGYFSGKNLLGEFAAIALLLSLHELLYSGSRRVLGIIVSVIAAVLLFLSSSKTALGLALVAPVLAGLVLLIERLTRISPAIVIGAIVVGYASLSAVTGFTTERLAYILTGDSSFTGRTVIWSFAETEIARSPIVGWGYQSFWLAGPDAPSIVDAPGWVKLMPNAHNGYYDTMLELGYIGLALLLIFLATTLHVIGRVHDNKRAWVLLSLALFIMIYNFLETLWLRAFDMSWVVFVIVAADAARNWQSSPMQSAARQSGPPTRSAGQARLRSEWRPRLGVRS